MEEEDYQYWVGRIYTRIRETRPNRANTTPIKIKVPLYVALNNTLPHVHPATDLPYCYAQNICNEFRNKKLLMNHTEEYGKIGVVSLVTISENEKHLLRLSKDEDSCYKGVPIKFFSLMATFGIKPKFMDVLVENNHVLDFGQLDCSISYGFDWTTDPEDVVYIIDKDGNKTIDEHKTLAYATNFRAKECSLVNRGGGACKGAAVLHQLSKTAIKSSYKRRFTQEMFDMLSKYGLISSKSFSKTSHNVRTTIGDKLSFLRGDRLEKLKYIEQFRELKKKKEEDAMSEEKKPGEKTDKVNGVDSDTVMKETKTLSSTTTETIPETTPKLNSTKTSAQSDDYLDKAIKAFSIDPNDFEGIGKQYVRDCYKNQEQFIERTTKEFPGKRQSFYECVNFSKDGDASIKMGTNENLDLSLKNVFTNPAHSALNDYLTNIFKQFKKFTKKDDTPTNKNEKIALAKETVAPKPIASKKEFGKINTNVTKENNDVKYRNILRTLEISTTSGPNEAMLKFFRKKQ